MTPAQISAALKLLSISCLFLSSCVSIQPYWTKPSTAIPSSSYTWHVLPKPILANLCPGADACTFQRPNGICDIFSFMSEIEAHQTFLTHKADVAAHELKHCEGWVHAS